MANMWLVHDEAAEAKKARQKAVTSIFEEAIAAKLVADGTHIRVIRHLPNGSVTDVLVPITKSAK